MAWLPAWARYRRDLAALNRKRSDIDNSYSKDLEIARKNHEPPDKIRSIQESRRWELLYADDEIMELSSRRLLDAARKLLIPVPEFNEENWEESSVTGGRFLTRQGMQELRRSIREEHKARREGHLVWGSALVGLIGALTGLASVLKG